MGTTITGNGREAEVEQVTKKKLMEDLKTVVVDAEELLKKQLPPRPGNGLKRRRLRRRNR